jgi:hypothetical protein
MKKPRLRSARFAPNGHQVCACLHVDRAKLGLHAEQSEVWLPGLPRLADQSPLFYFRFGTNQPASSGASRAFAGNHAQPDPSKLAAAGRQVPSKVSLHTWQTLPDTGIGSRTSRGVCVVALWLAALGGLGRYRVRSRSFRPRASRLCLRRSTHCCVGGRFCRPTTRSAFFVELSCPGSALSRCWLSS